MVKWLRLCGLNIGGLGSIPGQGHMLQQRAKIPHAATKIWHKQTNNFFFKKDDAYVQNEVSASLITKHYLEWKQLNCLSV